MFYTRVSAFSLFFVPFALACGGATQAANSPESAAPQSEKIEKAPADQEDEPAELSADASGKLTIPNECHKSADLCTPDPRWVKKLCQDVYPGVALYLFQSKSPFTHSYLSRKTKAVNASGGATSGSEWLAFDEEVVLLYARIPSSSGIVVSGAEGGYDAMRLDGSCVTLDASEVTMDVPPSPKYTEVPWRYLGDDMEAALLKVPAIKEAYIARRKECKGAFSGEVSAKCVKLDAALNATIVASLKNGVTDLPQPASRP